MTGIEKILQEIQEEGQKAAAALSAEGEAKIEALQEEIRRQTEAQCAEIARGGEEECRRIRERSHSSSRLLERRMLLEAKQELLEAVLEKAQASVYAMEDSAYFELLLGLIRKRALPQKGELLLSAGDQARLPDHFEQRLQKELPEGAQLEISRETREIRGGCVLLYGGVEENCSIEALFSAEREELTDLAQSILFQEG